MCSNSCIVRCHVFGCVHLRYYHYCMAKRIHARFETISVYMPLIGFDIARQIIWLLLLVVCYQIPIDWPFFLHWTRARLLRRSPRSSAASTAATENRDREATCFTRTTWFFVHRAIFSSVTNTRSVFSRNENLCARIFKQNIIWVWSNAKEHDTVQTEMQYNLLQAIVLWFLQKKKKETIMCEA